MADVYWKGGNAGVEGDFDEGLTSKTLDASATVDNGDGTVRIPCTAHTMLAGDYVVLDGTDSYDGNHKIVNVDGANTFDITKTFVTETFAVSDTAKSSNWQDKDGVPVAAPVAADQIIFDSSAGLADDRSSKHEEGAHWNLIGNIGQTDTGGLEAAGVLDESDFTGKLGVDSENTISPFHISIADGGEIVFRSNSEAYIECSAANSTTTINIPTLIHDTSSGFLKISSDVNSASYKSEWDTVKCLDGGYLELAVGTVCQSLYTYNSTVNLVIGTGCVDVSDSNDEIDLYLGSSSIHTTRTVVNKITCDGLVNFGSNALTLVKS